MTLDELKEKHHNLWLLDTSSESLSIEHTKISIQFAIELIEKLGIYTYDHRRDLSVTCYKIDAMIEELKKLIV